MDEGIRKGADCLQPGCAERYVVTGRIGKRPFG